MIEITAETLPLQSSMADEAMWVKEFGILQIRFKSGKIYRYEADDAVWADIKSTVEGGESFGAFFNLHLRKLPTWKKVRA